MRATDDYNRFQIKTKKKKQSEPRTKQVIVDSKKFHKLKRQASELEKEMRAGDRIKMMIEDESPNFKKLKPVSSSKNFGESRINKEDSGFPKVLGTSKN